MNRAIAAAVILAVLACCAFASCSFACCAFASSATADRAEARGDRPPNIILFLVDDLGQQDVSVPMLAEPSALNRRYRTPNLERLAARGVRFSNAYAAAPVCTPSRTAILTGQSPARTGITYWTLQRDTDQTSRHPRLDPPKWTVNGAQPSDANLPALLRARGYRTIHAGKAHFGANGTDGADPLRLGFDINIGGHAAGAPGSFLGTDHFKDAARKARASATTSCVLPRPGLPSSSTWPPASKPASTWLTTSRWPSTACSTCARSRAAARATATPRSLICV